MAVDVGKSVLQQAGLAANLLTGGFDGIFALHNGGTIAQETGITAVSLDVLSLAVLRRLNFFAEPEALPFMIAPLLVRHLWQADVGHNIVIAYPDVPLEPLLAANQMLKTNCEAVLLRNDDEAPVVFGLARNRRNERMVAHWADCIAGFSSDPRDQTRFSPEFGSRMVEFLCDRIGSLRQPDQRRKTNGLPPPASASFIQKTVQGLLPNFPQLAEDPAANGISVLNLSAPDVAQDPGSLITILMTAIHASRLDLQEAFDLAAAEGRRGFVEWFLTRAAVEFDVTEDLLAPVRMERENPSPAVPPAISAQKENPPRLNSAEGLNLIGYPRAEMGMGEQLRGCATALSTTNLSFGITDFNVNIIASHKDSRYDHLIRRDNPFNVNLFHINADQMRLAWDSLGPAFFRDHYNIGYWEWELSNFPDAWQSAIDLVDEIWAPSRFIQDAISRKTAKPVVWMPLAIEIPVIDTKGFRSQMGLPDDAFLFLFPFDFSSFSTRKNFGACVEAFRKAFPAGDKRAALVLKTIRHRHHQREFWELLRAIEDDPRIYIIDRVLRQPEMRQLIASCDSLVSLHRSEGFGLGLAEAMFLGKPVIATNYSGNVDFTKPENSCLVDYRLIPVGPDEYPFPEGQVWADPDTSEAAQYMRRLVEDREYAKRIAAAGAAFIRQQHSAKAVGSRYARRLKQIASARQLLSASATPTDNGGLLKSVVKKLF